DLGDGADILLRRRRIARREQAVDLPLRPDDEADAARHVAIERPGLLPGWPLRLRREAHRKPKQRRTCQTVPSHPGSPRSNAPVLASVWRKPKAEFVPRH